MRIDGQKAMTKLIGEWIRERLVSAGDSGVCISDLHHERKTNYAELGLLTVRSTYRSFWQYFYWLLKLGYIERTDKTEPSKAKGGEYQLKNPRLFFSITSKGLSSDIEDWKSIRLTKYPRPDGYKRKNYHKRTGGKRGRPRIGDMKPTGKHNSTSSESF